MSQYLQKTCAFCVANKQAKNDTLTCLEWYQVLMFHHLDPSLEF